MFVKHIHNIHSIYYYYLYRDGIKEIKLIKNIIFRSYIDLMQQLILLIFLLYIPTIINY